MPLHDVFYDGKAQSRAAFFSGAGLVDPIEPFKEPGVML